MKRKVSIFCLIITSILISGIAPRAAQADFGYCSCTLISGENVELKQPFFNCFGLTPTFGDSNIKLFTSCTEVPKFENEGKCACKANFGGVLFSPFTPNQGSCSKISTYLIKNNLLEKNDSCVWEVPKGFTLQDGEVTKKIEWKPLAPTLSINIPTLKPFTAKGIEKPDANGFVYIPFIGQYAAGVYKYLVLIAGIIAVVRIIAAGFNYVTAGGASQQIEEAKSGIAHALIGLLIVFGSYMVLYLINPDLVQFKSLKIKVIENMGLGDTGDVKGTHGPACTGQKLGANESTALPGVIASFGTLENFACGNRPLSQIKYAVIHEGAGDNGTIGVLEKRGFSTHFVIERNGTIKQTVDLRTVAIHANSANSFSAGIDLALPKTSKIFYENAQYDALNKLISTLASQTAIKKADDYIIGHCQIWDSDHQDPRGFDWSKIGLNASKHREGGSDAPNGNCIKSFSEEVVKQLIAERKAALKAKKPANATPSTTFCCHVPAEDITVYNALDCGPESGAISAPTPGAC